MSRFFINRPIVAMVISIITVIVGLVTLSGLPISKFPNIVPPDVQIQANYVGADALTLEQSVAAPIEEKMSGVDNMNYVYSLNANNGLMRMYVDYEVGTDPNVDQDLTFLRYSQAESQLPADVRNLGVLVQKATSSPFLFVSVFSPKGTHDAQFLANYAYINMYDELSRVKGIAQINVFGAGQYAMRIWVKPDVLARLNITVPEIVNAVNSQNTVNPAGRLGGNPAPPGQQFAFNVVAQGRLVTAEQFGQIVVRANPDGSVVRLKDVARIELGGQDYDVIGRYNGQAAANMSMYQLPGSNALDAAKEVKRRLEELKKRFPADIDYDIALDTTQAITEGMREIMFTFLAALALVTLVVFVFLQGWRATLIPLLAVPVSLVGTFAFFPLLGFSINTLSLFGLVLAVGLVVDDAIVVVECVERHMEEGLAPKAAALKAMSEVSGPVVAIALILSAVFVPTVFIPGITGRLYQQFAVTIAISVLISAFNALSLSPALAALILRPRKKGSGPLGKFFDWFNRVFARVTHGYVALQPPCSSASRPSVSTLLLAGVALWPWPGRQKLPCVASCRRKTRAISMSRATAQRRVPARAPRDAARSARPSSAKRPASNITLTVVGFSLLSQASKHLQRLFLCHAGSLGRAQEAGRTVPAPSRSHLNNELAKLPEASALVFPPPAIPGVGAAGGFTFILEDRGGKDPSVPDATIWRNSWRRRANGRNWLRLEHHLPAHRARRSTWTWTATRS